MEFHINNKLISTRIINFTINFSVLCHDYGRLAKHFQYGAAIKSSYCWCSCFFLALNNSWQYWTIQCITKWWCSLLSFAFGFSWQYYVRSHLKSVLSLFIIPNQWSRLLAVHSICKSGMVTYIPIAVLDSSDLTPS